MSMSNNKMHNSIDYPLEAFAQFYTGMERQAFLMLHKLVEGKIAVPYKIKKRDFAVELASTTAFAVTLIFKNVLIADGRHPMEIVMDHIRISKVGDNFKLKFVNALKQENPPKESAFIFDDIQTVVALWNYNFYTTKLTPGWDKLPWCLLDEPMTALLAKGLYLGDDSLNAYEKRIFPALQFLDVIFTGFLDSDTKIGFGRLNIYCQKDVLASMNFDDRQKQSGLELMEALGWFKLKELFERYEEDRERFFKAFICQLTDKAGKTLYTWLEANLKAATADYPRLKQVLPVYAGNHQRIRTCMDRFFKARGYRGSYPHYSKECRPAFVEVSQVYERKYTYINEKRKIELVSFIESIVEGCLTLAAVKGAVLGADRTNADGSSLTAIDGCFADRGLRRCEIAAVLTIDPQLSEDQVEALTNDFLKSLVK